MEILGESQLVGYPELADLNLSPQFPSVAMVNWTNGFGNARYWTLKVLLDNFQPGDKIVSTTVTVPGSTGDNPFCGDVLNLNPITLQCLTPSATIDKILFRFIRNPWWIVRKLHCGKMQRKEQYSNHGEGLPWTELLHGVR